MTQAREPLATLTIEQRRSLEQRLLLRRPARLEESRIRPRTSDEHLPLSFAQQRLWFVMQLDPNDASYNIHRVLRIKGALDVQRLQHAIERVCARHESLRTSFAVTEGRPRQSIAPPGPVPLPVVALDHTPEAAREDRLQALLIDAVRRPFDLATGPVLRAQLVRLAPDEHVLVLALHHIVADEWSLRLLSEEIDAAYRGVADAVAPLPIQYADFTLWQRRWLEHGAAAQLAYWREHLAGVPEALELMPGRSRPAIQQLRGAKHRWWIAPGTVQGLDRLACAERVTPFMLSLAAFMVLLHRYSGCDDIVVGTPISGRQRPETERLIGFFANTLALRASASGDPSFRDFLGRVRSSVLGGFANQDLPFEKVVDVVGHRRSRSHAPLFQVLFTHREEIDHVLAGTELDVSLIELDDGVAKCDLWLALVDRPEGRWATLEIDAALFEGTHVARLGGHLEQLLASIAATPEARLSELAMIPAAEQALLDSWSGAGRAPAVTGSLAGLFAAKVATQPEAIAVECGATRVSYAVLDRWSTRLAHRLRASGVGPDRVVAIAAPRTPALLAGLLAIVKAGGAYLPLDFAFPAARLDFMLRDAGAALVLASDAALPMLAAHGVPTLRLDATGSDLDDESTVALREETGPATLAYVMYTSGSTGTPKGVAIEQRGVIRLVRDAGYARFGAAERMLQLAPVSFDASTFEIWGALLNGGCVVQVEASAPSLTEIGRTIVSGGVTMLWLTAGLFHQMVDHELACFAAVGQVLAGGDVLSVAHVKRFRAAHPRCRLINGYGPTEATTFSCTCEIDDAAALDPSVPIGRPIANTQAYVLDGRQRPVPVGVAGELCLGGAGLARGYVNQAELTASRFVANPFVAGTRLYRTGDLVRWRDDGTLQFLGRLDRQVKLRGFRIEPGEIEAALLGHDAVRQAAVVARDDMRGEPRLAAYCVLDEQAHAPDAAGLRDYLRAQLPAYMIPAAITFVPTLPLTMHGKIDLDALSGIDVAEDSATKHVAPRDALEERLAAMWTRLLDRPRIGIHDDFFELGGHSLMAAELFAQIDKTRTHPLPLATIFDAPTIAQLAQIMRREHDPRPWESAVLLQRAGAQTPLFAVPGIGGNVVGFAALARHLDAEQPLIGLQARGLDGREAPLTRIEDIARQHIAQMRKLQPEGPYRLFGACIGGVIAFEMAQQLRRDGLDVALLAVLDPAFRGAVAPGSPAQRLRARLRRALGSTRFVVRRLRLYARDLATLPPAGWGRFLLGKLATLRGLGDRPEIAAGVRREIAQDRVIDAHRLALKAYRPTAYPGEVCVFRSADRRPRVGHAVVDLARLCPAGAEITVVPGSDSGAALHEPHVAVLVQHLRARLAQLRDVGAA